jgi:hypothetical protein
MNEFYMQGEKALKKVINRYNDFIEEREFKKARDILLTVEDKCQMHDRWHLFLGMALSFMGKEYLDEADKAFDKSIELIEENMSEIMDRKSMDLIKEKTMETKKNIRSKEFEKNWE